MSQSFEARLADHYSDLSDALKLAADFLVENPVEIATRPLRAVSQESGVSPATFSRLARALGYDDFNALREEMRERLERRVNNFSDRASQLQAAHRAGQSGFFSAHLAACQANLQSFAETVDQEALLTVADRLSSARKVMLIGALGSTGVVEYLSYMANFFAETWQMAGRMGASLGGGLTGLGAEDALIIVTKPPFSDRAIRAAKVAQSIGVYVVVITDTHSCPALKHASAQFIVPTQSPHFYSSYMVTLFLVEALIGMIVGRSGDHAQERIAQVEKANRILAEVWDG